MLNFNLSVKEEPLKILCLGSHSDDIEIGCGGTLLKLLDENPEIQVTWVVFAAQDQRSDEAKLSAEAFLDKAMSRKIYIENFEDGFFPYKGEQIKEYFEDLKSLVSPDLVFTHYRDDLHQDHRVISELTWNTFRDHLILEYEIIKYDGDLGSPNLFVHLDDSICSRKIEILMTHHITQGSKDWFTPDTFLSLMRLRGMESRTSASYAEGFYARKIIL
jgi:LmbE family N-acetylglucosaminyl deacetylase